MAQAQAATGHPALFSDRPAIRTVTGQDLRDALARGYTDFMAMPSHLAFIGLIYPIVGLFLASFAFGYDVLPLLFPLASGFALIGPLAGIGLYEVSRERENGEEPHWNQAFRVFRSPAIASIVGMGAVLVVIFLLWLASAHVIFQAIIGPRPDLSYTQLLREILTTSRGWALILVGNAVGFAFAVLVLTISVIAFPMILDRNCGVGAAMETSRRAVLANPVPMALWGAIVAGFLVLGSIPVFVGLAIAMPVLGHATWHLYRMLVER